MNPFFEYQTELLRCFTVHHDSFFPHLHNAPELIRVRAGTVKVIIHSQEYIVTSGNLVIIFPNLIHSYQTLSAEEDTIIDFLVCGKNSNNGFPNNLYDSFLVEPVKPISTLHPDIDYIFSALLNEDAAHYDTYILNAYLHIFWRRLLPELTITNSTQPVISDLTTTLITYVSEHYCEPLSLEMLSKELGVCRFYISRIFTQVLHTGFHEYINALRIDYAKNLLLSGQYNILDIAMQCGFQSQRTFNRVFREICGITPTAYRKQDILSES